MDRGLEFTHEVVCDWEARFAPLITDVLWQERWGAIGPSCYVDEIYIKVKGRWCYLYQAINRDGDLVDCRLSETWDIVGARAFFREALSVTETKPERVTTDGHDAYPGAIEKELGEDVLHRTNRYLNKCDRHGSRLAVASPAMALGRREHVGEGKGARRNPQLHLTEEGTSGKGPGGQ